MNNRQGQPIFIMPEDTERQSGKDAQRNNIMAAKVVADTVKTTLGPKGMDKMLVDSADEITVTNDGVTILEEMDVNHPAAKMMVEIANTQEDEVGDGTTTAVMLGGRLLENAEELLDRKIHPTVITKGYRLASKKAQEILNNLTREVKIEDEELLGQIAKTAMTGKGAESVREKFAGLIVEAVKQIANDGKVNLNNIKIEKAKGNGIEDTDLVKGIVLDKEKVSVDMPSSVEDAKIALINTPLEIKSPESDTNISVSSPQQLQSFVKEEEEALKEMVSQIKNSGANVIFCQKGIDDLAQYYLAKEGIYACRRVAKSDMEKLARATDGKVVSNLGEIEESQLGEASVVEIVEKGDESFTYVRGCNNPKALTLLLHGGTDHVIDEMERAIKDGLGDVASVIKDGRVVAGGGAVEVELAKELRKFSHGLEGREQLAAEKFADALETVPTTLAENAGMDPIDTLTELKSRHDDGEDKAGLNLFEDKIEDVTNAGIVEPLSIKRQAINSASEVAMMILRIDDVIKGKGKGGGQGGAAGGAGAGGMGGGLPPGLAGMGG